MENLLFSDRSVLALVHGVFFGGGAMLLLFAALFGIIAMRADATSTSVDAQSRYLAWALVAAAALLWFTTLQGTYFVFPPYRATPPDGIVDLSQYPRALIHSDPSTVWLHAFGMEVKEHVPWMAVMLTTGTAYVAVRYRSRILTDKRLRRTATWLILVSFMIASVAGLLGTFANKVAPLE